MKSIILYTKSFTFEAQRDRAEMADKATVEKAIGEGIANFTTRRGNRIVEKWWEKSRYHGELNGH